MKGDCKTLGKETEGEQGKRRGKLKRSPFGNTRCDDGAGPQRGASVCTQSAAGARGPSFIVDFVANPLLNCIQQLS